MLVLWGSITPAFPWPPGCLQCLLMCDFRLSGSYSVCMAWWHLKRRGGILEVSQGDRCGGESYTFWKEGYSCAWVQILEIPMCKSRFYLSLFVNAYAWDRASREVREVFWSPFFHSFLFHEFRGLNPAITLAWQSPYFLSRLSTPDLGWGHI